MSIKNKKGQFITPNKYEYKGLTLRAFHDEVYGAAIEVTDDITEETHEDIIYTSLPDENDPEEVLAFEELIENYGLNRGLI